MANHRGTREIREQQKIWDGFVAEKTKQFEQHISAIRFWKNQSNPWAEVQAAYLRSIADYRVLDTPRRQS